MSLFGCFTGGPPPPPPPNPEVADLQKTVSKLHRKLASSQAAEQALKQQLEESSAQTEADRHEVDSSSIACLIKAQEDAASASRHHDAVKEELADLQQRMEAASSAAQQGQEDAAKLLEAARVQLALADKAMAAVKCEQQQAETASAAALQASDAAAASLHEQLLLAQQQLADLAQASQGTASMSHLSASQATTLSSSHLSTLQQQQQQAADFAAALAAASMQQVLDSHATQAASAAAETQALRAALAAQTAGAAAQLQAALVAQETESIAQSQAVRDADQAEATARLEAVLEAERSETAALLQRAGAASESQLALQGAAHAQACTTLSAEAAALREQLEAARQQLLVRDTDKQSMVAQMAELHAKATAHDMVLDSTADTTSELLKSYQALKAQHTALQADVKVKEEMFELLQQQVQELAGLRLVGLLQQVPPLLEACVSDDRLTLTRLRLVNEECSRSALLGLKSFTITLDGSGRDADARVARLLQHARLRDLHVYVRLSDHFEPAPLLGAFVREAEPPLSTVTSLVLVMEDERSLLSNMLPLDPQLGKALARLAGACTVLTSLQFQGSISPGLVLRMGQACPLLTSLAFVATHRNRLDLQAAVKLVAGLPGLTKLALHDIQHELPDMSANHGLRSLSLEPFSFRSDAEWRQLPPNLTHLACSVIASGPPAHSASGGRGLLGSLLGLELGGAYPRLQLGHLAKLLRAAPLLASLTSPGVCEGPATGNATICCHSALLTAGADLSLLLQRMDALPAIGRARYLFVCDYDEIIWGRQNGTPGSLQPFIASLPGMPGVSWLDVSGIEPADLASLLDKFPDLLELTLRGMVDMDDLELQQATAAKGITGLKMLFCHSITPMGLLALCQRLPMLRQVTCVVDHTINGCGLRQPDLDRCAQLLLLLTQREVLIVLESGDSHEVEESEEVEEEDE
ncbi:MAG: hypothetical protein WDW36_002650 [Sanguina aurantia]